MKKSFKYVVWAGGFVVFLIALALILPFLIDLNKFKPQIQAAVSENVNAQLDFSSARLQFFPRIGVKLRDVSVVNSDAVYRGTKFFSVGSVLLDAKLIPLFKKKFEGQVIIDGPQIQVVKSGAGNNIAALKKEAPAPAAPGQPAPQTPPAPGSSAPAPQTAEQKQENLRLIKENVLITAVLVNSAQVVVIEREGSQTRETLNIKDLDMEVKNIGLDRDIDLKISTNFKVNEAGSVVEGPFVIQSKQRVSMNAAGLERVVFEGKIDLDQLDIRFKDVFKKAAKIPLHTSFKGVMGANTLDLQSFEFVMHTMTARAQAKIADLKTLKTDLTLNVDDKNLGSFGELLPQHKHLLVSARIKLDLALNGLLSDPQTVKLNSKLDTDLSGSDLKMDLVVSQVKPIKGSMNVQSKKFDFDGVLGPFMKDSPAQQAPAAGASSTPAQTAQTPANEKAADVKSPSAPAAQQPPKDFALTPEQRQQLTGSDFALQANFGQMTAKGFDIRNLIVDLVQKSLLMQLNRFSVTAFEGTVSAKGQVDLNPNPVAFNLVTDFVNIKPDNVMVFIKPEHKDVVKGKADVHIAMSGRGTTMPSLSKTLNGKGSYSFHEGQLNTPSIAQALQKKFDEFVSSQSVTGVTEPIFKSAEKLLASSLGSKLPKNEQFDVNKYREKYKAFSKTVVSDNGSFSRDLKNAKGQFEIKNGRVYIDSKNNLPAGLFDTHASVGLDMTLGGTTVYTASEGTKKRMLSQTEYAALLFDEKGQLVVEGELSGTVTDPRVMPRLEKAKANFTRNASSLVEKEVKKAAEEYLKKLIDSQKKKFSEDIQKKVDEQVKKNEGEAKKKAEEQIKGQLKGLFGK